MNEKIKNIVYSLVEKNQENSIINICKNENIEIIESEIRSVEGICINCFDDKFIVLNDSLSPLTRDYVTGHELGHAKIHDDDLMYLKNISSYNSSRLEYEANYFSVCLLYSLKKEYEIESEIDEKIIKEINKIIY